MAEIGSALPRVPVSLPDRIERACEPSIRAARHGQLSASLAQELASGDVVATDRTLAALPRTSLLPLLRHVFSKAASWCLFHVEYMDSLVAILRALGTNTVLEVCAGSGTLIEPMRLRGLTWHAADARPPPHAYGVMAAQAIDAIRNTDLMPTGTQGRVVFWSWWSTAAQSKKRKAQTYPVQAADDAALMAEAPPLSPPEDVLVVRESLARGDIIIFVGEPRGGLTGSLALWDGPWHIRAAADLWSELYEARIPEQGRDGIPTHRELFADVVQWPGFSDRTWVIVDGGDGCAAR